MSYHTARLFRYTTQLEMSGLPFFDFGVSVVVGLPRSNTPN